MPLCFSSEAQLRNFCLKVSQKKKKKKKLLRQVEDQSMKTGSSVFLKYVANLSFHSIILGLFLSVFLNLYLNFFGLPDITAFLLQRFIFIFDYTGVSIFLIIWTSSIGLPIYLALGNSRILTIIQVSYMDFFRFSS